MGLFDFLKGKKKDVVEGEFTELPAGDEQLQLGSGKDDSIPGVEQQEDIKPPPKVHIKEYKEETIKGSRFNPEPSSWRRERAKAVDKDTVWEGEEEEEEEVKGPKKYKMSGKQKDEYDTWKPEEQANYDKKTEARQKEFWEQEKVGEKASNLEDKARISALKAEIARQKSIESRSNRNRFIAKKETLRDIGKMSGNISRLGMVPVNRSNLKGLYGNSKLADVTLPSKGTRSLNTIGDIPAKEALKPNLGGIVALQPRTSSMQRYHAPSTSTRMPISQKARGTGNIRPIADSPVRSKALNTNFNSTPIASKIHSHPSTSLVAHASRNTGISKIGSIARGSVVGVPRFKAHTINLKLKRR